MMQTNEDLCKYSENLAGNLDFKKIQIPYKSHIANSLQKP